MGSSYGRCSSDVSAFEEHSSPEGARLELRNEQADCRPVVELEPLTVRAEQLSVDGSKIRAAGSISANDEVCVEAEGLFTAIRLTQTPDWPISS
jgi:hypothetical protein